MNPTSNLVYSRADRGVAMLVTMFALLLLSVVGLGMMYSTNVETFINANYRDKQTATYAAMAGLQEARDRLRLYDPTSAVPKGRIVAPDGLPVSTDPYVIYIINPKNGETVEPWTASSSNPYMDTELCHENFFGLSGTNGVPCTTTPTGTSWYRVYDDSLNSMLDCGADCFWHSSNPLDFKWVRINLKANNSTPIPANGDASDARQVCWDGKRQVVLQNGYSASCTKFGSVVAVNITNPGSGYTSAPTVAIAAPGGSGIQATATANIEPTDGQVTAISVVSQGSDYSPVPTVTIDPPASGTQAAAHVCVSSAECAQPYVPLGASIASVTISSAGTNCYTSEPAVLFTGGGGAGASASVPLSSLQTCIAAWSVTGVCNAHKGDTITSIGLSGGGGSGFQGTLQFDSNGNIVTGYPTIQASGSGYTTSPTAMTNISGCGNLTFSVIRGKRVAAPQVIIPSSGGGGYSSAPSISVAAGTGTSDSLPAGIATLGPQPVEAGKVRQIIIDNGGSGYSDMMPPNVTINTVTSGSGATAAATVTASGFKLTSITVNEPGAGYTAEPMVTISGGGGSGATAKAILGNGANWGRVYLITALARTSTGARTMLQMEAATAVSGFGNLGALTIDGPSPTMGIMPNSQNFTITGNDAAGDSSVLQPASCNGTPNPVQPAVGGYDDPNADVPTTSVDDIIDSLPDDRLDHYTGEGDYPSVRNVYDSLGETLGTTSGLQGLIQEIQGNATNSPGTVDFGTPNRMAVNYVNGDLDLNGNTNGYGVLVVTGTLTMSGNFTWYGTVLVVGDGVLNFSGGGNGSIVGTALVAKIYPSPSQHSPSDLLSTLGSPTVGWNGGGTNNITLDHCWIDATISTIPSGTPVSLKPLKILSVRSLPY